MSWFNLRASGRGRVVIDIGSSSVSANVVVDNKILFSDQKEVLFGEKLNFKEFFLKINQALEELMASIQSSPSTAGIRSYRVFLSSPFCLATAQNSVHTSPKLFTVNQRLINNLLKSKISEIITQQKSLVSNTEVGDWEAVEKKIVRVKLDGYEIEKYIGRQTDSLEISWFFSLASKTILNKLRETIQKTVRTEDIKFHSFVFAAYESLIRLGIDNNFLLIDVSGELTDVVLITEGIIRDHLSFPIGLNSIVRKFNRQTDGLSGETSSQMKTLLSGHFTQDITSDLNQKLKTIGEEWLNQIEEILKVVSETSYIPRSILLIGEDQMTELFANWLDDKKFSSSTFGPKQFQTTIISKDSLHETLNWPEKVSHNSFLILETLFCDKIEGEQN